MSKRKSPPEKQTSDTPAAGDVAEGAVEATDVKAGDAVAQAEASADAPLAVVQTATDLGELPEEVVVNAEGEVDPLIIVGIGASAGGLEALKELVAGLPLSDSLTYVVAQHLSPTHTSLLGELLKPETSLALLDVKDGIKPVANAIYVTPPNQDVEVVKGRLHLVKPRASVGPKPSVDHLFQSMADYNGENSVGIILSGTGSDGAAGIRAIKAAGGITLVQDPETSKYDGMPRAAIQTGAVDRVVPATRMGEMVEAVVATPAKMRLPAEEDEKASAYARITSSVKRATGFDLNHYKQTTIDRRVLRRMGLHKCTTVEAYADIVKSETKEAQALAKDVLISVTSFFRDQSSFDVLRTHIEQLVKDRTGNDVIRVWVAGCATGEEAYTLAMCFSEAIRESTSSSPEFLIFATDIDSDAVGFARNGVYHETTVEVLPRYLRERYFDSNGRVYQVKKSLRQSMVFAAQNVIEDPPFSRMDLITCRNLLIYLNRPVQRRVLEIFHYALRTRGMLFLGKSESIELHKELFEDVDKSSRVFRRRETMTPHYTVPLRSRNGADDEGGASSGRRSNDPLTNSFRLVSAIAEQLGPPAVIVNSSDEVIHFNGDLKPFLRFPKGPADLKVFELVHDEVRGELRALIHRARRENLMQEGNAFKARMADTDQFYICRVSPLLLDKQSLVVVSFELNESQSVEVTLDSESAARESLIIDELERELSSTRQHLQTVVEELETTNEELLSQSEELQSANEELQSTNEELQTSNEELQSTNEELMTVNDELQSKSHELTLIAGDLQAVKESIDYPLLVVNEKLHITHFNQSANASLPKDDLQPGMSVTSVDWHIGIIELLPKIREVVRSGRAHEVRIEDERGRKYLVRIMSAPSVEGVSSNSAGAVLFFLDVSDQVAEQASLREREATYSLVFDLSAVGTALINRDLTIKQANQSLGRLFEVPQDELLQRKFPELFVEAYHQQIRDLLDDLFCGERKSIFREMEVRSLKGNLIWVNFSAIAVDHENDKVTRIVVQLQDITAAKLRQQDLLAERLRLHLHANIAGLMNADGDENRLLNDIAKSIFNNVSSSRVSITMRASNDELRVVASRQAEGIPSVNGVQLTSQSAKQLIASLESMRKTDADRDDDSSSVADLDHDAAPSDWLGSRALAERINLPLFENDRIVGFLSVERLQGRPFDLDEQDALRSIAELIVLKIKEVRSGSRRAADHDALNIERHRLVTTMDNVGEGVVTFDQNQLIDYANPVALKMLGSAADKWIGKSLEDVISFDQGDQSSVSQVLAKNAAKDVLKVTVRVGGNAFSGSIVPFGDRSNLGGILLLKTT